ncbi:hypothetical protein [Planobispora longispora]|uniref:Uncharacterized protein n=1 Tax=Planobispora longispora TaxID=28887 RepID=A0A8J3W5P5_9ACTN|nr:hypothetical protein [Planobispora longispora]BFE85940.1 hypothetical protein GCM10020093_085410 [Planobispora longispora]GIH76051.1 hypothetical protein Plo01_24800 [Planobispora longispora]
MAENPIDADSRYTELRKLGEEERYLARGLQEVRAEIASLVHRLLPHHSRAEKIDEVVKASGYSRHLIDVLRYKDHPWHRHSSKRQDQ